MYIYMVWQISAVLCNDRDDPRVGTAFIVSNDASAGCEIRLEAENMFTAIK